MLSNPEQKDIANGLLRKVAKGDEAAFRQLYDMYRERFYFAAFKMTRSADAAEEVVQDVFVRVWNKRAWIAAARSPFAYFLKILQHSIYTHFRKIVRDRRLALRLAELAPGEEGSAEEMMIAREDKALLNSIIERLPRQQQLIYRLSKEEHMSREDIARELGVSPHTVRNHLAEAMKFIRQALKNSASAAILLAILKEL